MIILLALPSPDNNCHTNFVKSHVDTSSATEIEIACLTGKLEHVWKIGEYPKLSKMYQFKINFFLLRLI